MTSVTPPSSRPIRAMLYQYWCSRRYVCSGGNTGAEIALFPSLRGNSSRKPERPRRGWELLLNSAGPT